MNRQWLLGGAAILLIALFFLPDILGVGAGQILVFLLVLLCPLTHFFMRHGSHGQGGHAKPPSGAAAAPPSTAAKLPPAEGEGAARTPR